MRKVIGMLLYLTIWTFALGQTGDIHNPVSEIEAIRTSETIEIDGQLNESVWKQPGYTRLIQRDPIEGEEPTEETSVWIAYNEEGLFVAGLCSHSGQDSVVGGLARRDREVESDWFWFWIDPNVDRQNAFGFAVNPDGSIIDQKLFQDLYEDWDWDGLWEAAAQRHLDHWSFEMFIPYSQLRFNKKEEYEWGVNFKRYILANAEHDYFVMVPKEETGFVSRFGRLTGLRNIAPPPRLFIAPYVMSKINDFPALQKSPFFHGQKYGTGMGVDIKYGLTGNLTLDLAINPDFGQAEVDPARINLSAFETYYAEKRAFFIEGSDIFEFGASPTGGVWGCYWSDPSIFYSRRIGRRPKGSPTQEGEVLMPEQTTILGAAKVSGKIGKWSIGSITAMTQQEDATILMDDGTRIHESVEPQSYYGVLRAAREINEGDQGLGFMVTGVARNQDTPELQLTNNSEALVMGADGWTFFGKNRDWALMGKFAYTSVFGTSDRITRLQKSSNHFYQRPDFKSVSLDTNRTSLSGYMGRFGFRKMRGNFMFHTALGFISPGFNTNDLGYNSYGNVLNMHVVAGYRWLEPTSWYRRIYFNVMTSRNFDWDGNRLFQQYYTALSVLLINYISMSSSYQYTPGGLDLFDTRGGPIIGYPTYSYSNFSISTDSRKSIQAALNGNYRNVRDGSYSKSVGASLRLKASSSMKFTLSADYMWGQENQQWVNNIEDPQAQYGHHYIFSTIRQERTSATIRLDWGFTQRLSLQCYFQPFIAVGDYHGFKELAQAGTCQFRPYDYTDHNPDFNYKSFKGNVVLRWEYKPGSLFYFVWTRDQANYDRPGNFQLGKDLKSLFSEKPNNIFYIKMSYNISMF